jgi:hypothetical protein
MALNDILLPEGDSLFDFEVSSGVWANPLKDIMMECCAIMELPYVSSSTGLDILSNFTMVSEILPDNLQVFIDTEGRIAIRLDKQTIKILD